MNEETHSEAVLRSLDEIKAQLHIMNGYQREDHDRITRLEERMKIFTGIQAAISLLLSAIAAALGRAG